jgi:hypothetical protein
MGRVRVRVFIGMSLCACCERLPFTVLFLKKLILLKYDICSLKGEKINMLF